MMYAGPRGDSCRLHQDCTLENDTLRSLQPIWRWELVQVRIDAMKLGSREEEPIERRRSLLTGVVQPECSA